MDAVLENRLLRESYVKTSQKAQSYLPAKELAEVHRDVFNFLAHEMGGLAGAMGLRIDALETVMPKADQAALRGLADQTRDIYRLLRLLDGPRGESFLAPARTMSATEWWRVASRMIGADLPRGMTIVPILETAVLSPRQSHLLTTVLLLACRDVQDRGVQVPSTLRARFEPVTASDTGTVVTLELPTCVWPETVQPRINGRWQRYASRLAKRSRFELAWWHKENTVMRWRCVVR